MSLLTDQEIHAADPAPHERFDQERIDFARAIEQAVIRKLATVGVEPVAQWKKVSGFFDLGPPTEYEKSLGWAPLYPAEAIAAARVRDAERQRTQHQL